MTQDSSSTETTLLFTKNMRNIKITKELEHIRTSPGVMTKLTSFDFRCRLQQTTFC